LPDTADELDAVARDLGVAASDIHLGADASETAVKRAPLADYGIVYFATHGLVAGDVKGLAEKQPPELDDGLLAASEVAQLKLNADWVALSACNTIAAISPARRRCPASPGRSSTPASGQGSVCADRRGGGPISRECAPQHSRYEDQFTKIAAPGRVLDGDGFSRNVPTIRAAASVDQ
jgi:hypothetical protein